jgi:adenine C2-methylase RlmN of 23S rRNA A2503 and tRNA A37
MKMLNKKEQYVISKTVEDLGTTEDKYMLIEGVIDTEERAEQVLEFLANNEYNRLVADGERLYKEVKSSNKIIIGVGIIGGYNIIYEIHKTYKWD